MKKIKAKARKSLKGKITKRYKNYVIDTSAITNKFLGKLIKKGMIGTLIIPNVVVAELENLANKGIEEGFIGLDEIAKLHKLKHLYNIKICFYGPRPSEHQIKYAKSGEIDAVVREIAFKKRATLVTADLVQAKSAQAYNVSVIFLKPRKRKQKKFQKKFLWWKRRPRI